MKRSSGPRKTASNRFDSIPHQLNMYAVASVVVISLLALTTLFARPLRTAVSTEAEQPLSITTSNGQDDYLAAVEPLFPNQNFVGHCHVVAGVMTGYCEGGGILVCASRYVPRSCPPSRRVKHVVTTHCGYFTIDIPRYWHTCTP